jgi:hypothetical protein
MRGHFAMTTNTAENATAGVAVVRGLEWTMEMIPPAGEWLARSFVGLYSIPLGMGAYQLYLRDGESMGQFSEVEDAQAFAQADYEQRITAALNPDFLSELDTARAEIERLRERLRDIIDERDNLSTIIATEIDDVAGAELDDMEERATRAESALTSAQARIAEQHRALELAEGRIALLLQVFPDPDGESDHPTATQYVLDAIRATLSPAVKEPK